MKHKLNSAYVQFNMKSQKAESQRFQGEAVLTPEESAKMESIKKILSEERDTFILVLIDLAEKEVYGRIGKTDK